jgi:hypothetical protein
MKFFDHPRSEPLDGRQHLQVSTGRTESGAADEGLDASEPGCEANCLGFSNQSLDTLLLEASQVSGLTS